MDINGKWIMIIPFGNKTFSFTIENDVLTYKPKYSKTNEDVACNIELKEHPNLVGPSHGIKCFDIVFDDNSACKMDIVYHEETVDGKYIGIISEKVFEHDGRGWIVLMEYVQEKNADLVNKDFRSILYYCLNDRERTPMMELGKAMMMGMNGQIIITNGMSTMNGSSAMPSTNIQPTEPWTCPACGTPDQTGKFCGECGSPKISN